MDWSLIIMSAVYILAGLNHFKNPKLYESIIPPFFENKKWINYISGLMEVVLGIGLLIEETRSISAIGIIILLIAVFPANIYMCIDQKAGLGFSKVFLYLRLPLQFVLIYWAYLYIG